MSREISVLVVGNVSAWLSAQLEKIRRQGYPVHVLSPDPNASREQIIHSIKTLPHAHYSAFVSLTHTLQPFDAEVIEPLMPHLRFATEPGAGYEDVDVDFMTEHGIYFANNPQAVSVPTATTATMLIMQTVRAASQAEARVRAGRWREGLEATPDIRDLTLGIVGLGTIGKIVHKQVKALGVKEVIYNNRHRLSPEEGDGAKYVSLEDLIRTADIISLHTPLTDETHHMISETQFKQMKTGVFIVNTSRGAGMSHPLVEYNDGQFLPQVIDEEALVRALQSGKVCRVGLDVFEREPSVHPWLSKSDRCTLLPHWAAATTRVSADSEKEILANLQAWITTGKPNSPVNEPRMRTLSIVI